MHLHVRGVWGWWAGNRLWRRLYTTGIALSKMASFTQSTVYQILHWYLHLDEPWTVLSVWLLALSKVKTETWKALGVAQEVFPQCFSCSLSDTSPHLWEENQSYLGSPFNNRVQDKQGNGISANTALQQWIFGLFQPSHTLVTTKATVPQCAVCMLGSWLAGPSSQGSRRFSVRRDMRNPCRWWEQQSRGLGTDSSQGSPRTEPGSSIRALQLCLLWIN